MDPLEETIKTFDKYAVEYEVKYMNHLPYVETYRALSGLLNADASILDAACGPGNIASFLLHEFPRRKLLGIDLSENMVARARLNNPAASFEIMDCREVILLARTFDAIVAGFCFPYLSGEEVRNFIADSRRMLNDKGILYLSFMEGNVAASGMTSRNGTDWVCTYYHNADSVVDTLKLAGFDVIDLIRKPFEPESEPSFVDVFIYARAV